MSQNQLDSLPEGEYHIYIDSELFDGSLTKIGAIIFLSQNLDQLKENLVAGIVLSCLGDGRDYSIVHSRYADTIAGKSEYPIGWEQPLFKTGILIFNTFLGVPWIIYLNISRTFNHRSLRSKMHRWRLLSM